MDRSRIPALSSCPRLRAQLAQESGLCPSAFSAEQPNVAIGVFVVNPADRVCQKNFLSVGAHTMRDHSRARSEPQILFHGAGAGNPPRPVFRVGQRRSVNNEPKRYR
jgi:hypothetical protein